MFQKSVYESGYLQLYNYTSLLANKLLFREKTIRSLLQAVRLYNTGFVPLYHKPRMWHSWHVRTSLFYQPSWEEEVAAKEKGKGGHNIRMPAMLT